MSATPARSRRSSCSLLLILHAKIKSRELSAVEVAQAHLDRIAEIDGEIHAFLYVDGERALAIRGTSRCQDRGWR